MKKGERFVGTVIWILTAMLAPDGGAQHSAEKVYQHLQQTFDRHEGDLHDYLIRELDAFGLTFADSSQAADAMHLLAQLYTEKGKKWEALASICKTLYLYPTSTAASKCRTLLQTTFLPEKDFAEKKAILQGAMDGPAVDAGAADRWYAFLNILKELDEDKLNRYAAEQARLFIIHFPRDERIYPILEWLGGLYAGLGEKYDAIFTYRKLEQLYPGDPRLPFALYQQALLLSDKAGKHEEAVSRCARIVANYPASELAPSAACKMGEIREEKLKDHAGAIQAYRLMVDTWPQDSRAVDALLAISEIQEKKNRNFDAALLTLDEIVQKYHSNPLGVTALTRTGDIYAEEKKDYARAAASYAKIAELYPTDEKATQMLMKAGSLCEEKLKDYHQAIGYYQIILDKYPKNKRADDAKGKIAKATEKL
jgi:TolA-binding protein